MDRDYLHQRYFQKGTRGCNILSRFYQKYRDLFVKTGYQYFEEFLNQVFANLSQIDTSNIRKKEEDYVIGAIHIQCRSLLDKAIKGRKTRSGIILSLDSRKPANDETSNTFTPQSAPAHLESLEAGEILKHLSYFKRSLDSVEKAILNALIDGKSRRETAAELKLNMNTLDTKIRRLRIELVDYLKKLGYEYTMFEKYSK